MRMVGARGCEAVIPPNPTPSLLRPYRRSKPKPDQTNVLPPRGLPTHRHALRQKGRELLPCRSNRRHGYVVDADRVQTRGRGDHSPTKLEMSNSVLAGDKNEARTMPGSKLHGISLAFARSVIAWRAVFHLRREYIAKFAQSLYR